MVILGGRSSKIDAWLSITVHSGKEERWRLQPTYVTCSQLAERHQSRDTTARKAAMAELSALPPLTSQHNPGNEIPEEHWLYRFAKRHWYFGFGAYS